MVRALVEGGGRESPGVRVTFFCFAKRKSPKKRRPPVCDPFAVRRGKPAACRLRGAPWNSLRCVAASFRHPRRVSSRSTRASTRVLTPQPPRRRRSQQGGDSRTAIRAIAALGLARAARGACARETGPSAAQRSEGVADSRVAFLLGTFLWRSKEKYLARRATPGLRPQPRHEPRPAQGLDKLNPNGWKNSQTIKTIATSA